MVSPRLSSKGVTTHTTTERLIMLTDYEKRVIEETEAELSEHPSCKGCQQRKKFSDWLKNKTFPFKFSFETSGYFREEVKQYNRLAADLICADIEYDLNYEKDFLHITLENEGQIKDYEEVFFKWWMWCDKRNATHMPFVDMFIGSGIMNTIVEEGDE